ncbi:hypothetical protein CASFOL_014674 [Castilleja foliolosa]|uniref:Pentatricopeptide repeat-containing protein n=1 Tax=Castilleja foliolosa TaxID=1961234 RepID=A0ABD3DDN4_9LAMI
MSKALLSLIKPRHHPQPKFRPPSKTIITPHIRKFAYEVCEILKTQDKKWEETLQNRFFEEEIAPSEVAHLVFDKIPDCESGLKFFTFLSQNSLSLDGFAYSSLLKLLARYKLFEEIDNVLSDCTNSEDKLPTRDALGFVIRSYAESGLVSKALDLYFLVLKHFSEVPHVSACNSLLDGLVKDDNMKAAWNVFDEMSKRDDCVDNYSVCIMVKGLCKEGKVERGRKLIEKKWGKNCIPNIVFYNTLINGYCKCGNINTAYGLLEELKMKGFLPTHETYGSIINGFCRKSDFKKVDGILKEMESSGLKIDVRVYNNILDAKYKYGFFDEALKTMRKMVEKGIDLDIVTYNTLISNACKDGKVLEAEKLLEEVINSRLVPNKLSFTPLIHAYCREGEFDRASSLLVRMTEHGQKPDLTTYGGLIHGLVASGEIEAALMIKNKIIEKELLSLDACIYNILMNGLCKAGNFADAKQLLGEMLGFNISPDAYVYATLVDGYIRNGNFDDAKNFFDDIIKRGIDPGLVGYNAMIKGYCKFGKMKDAISCIKKMIKKNIFPDKFTYSTVIDGYVKQNDLYGALAVFCHALKLSYAPNVITCTSLISGFCNLRDFDGAEIFFKGIQNNGIIPNVVTYTVFIGSCCKDDKIGKASSFFEQMLTSKCDPNDVTFHYLVNGLSNNVNRINSEYDQDNKPMILDIFGRIISDGYQSISAAYVSIVACLCLKGMLRNALLLIDKMLRKGFVLDSVSLAALLHGVCLVGRSKEFRGIVGKLEFVELKVDVALKYLSLFKRYSNHEATTEASRVLHTFVEERKSSDGNFVEK